MNVSKTIMLTVLVISMTMLAWTSHAEEPLIPKEMVYVGHGPSMMGLDKGEPAELGGKLTAYDRRMKTPWSAEALNDEGPAHMGKNESFVADRGSRRMAQLERPTGFGITRVTTVMAWAWDSVAPRLPRP